MDAAELSLRKFVSPEFTFGIGARFLVGRAARNLGATRVLLVTDPGVVAAGWADEATAHLDAAGVPHATFTDVTPNPRAEQVMAGAERYRAEGCDAIVALGGGSPIDCAKGIGIVCANGGHILDYEGVDEVAAPMPPLICVPTTGGTSADVSQFAIISDPRRRTKIAIISKAVVPDVALIDPQTLTTMDAYLTACTGMDALVHAIEAFVSRASSPITDLHALEAIRLIAGNLVATVQAPHDLERRTRVMLGSLEAGLAFSNASLGANHALAHSLGGWLDLPHGECNAILLPHVMAYNHAAAPERFAQIGVALGLDLRGMGTAARQHAILAEIARLRQAVRIERGLGAAGVHRTDVPELAAHALQDPCLVTNPRRANQRDLEVVYEEAL
jgi:alcohol dehydrogenase